MIPCKHCGPSAGAHALLKGLKQIGKTRTSGTRFERRYRCQDCGATCTMRGDLTSFPGAAVPRADDEWSLPPQR